MYKQVFKPSFTIAILLFIFISSIQSQTIVSDSISLNGVWKFKSDLYKKGMEEKWFLPSTSTLSWNDISVPGSWDTHNEYAHFTGDAWYKRTFTIPQNLSTKNIQLIFESVYNYAEVWLNGVKIGDNNLGYLAFQFNITKNLKFGTSNTLVVRVNNTFKLGATWNWGGIRLPVWLEISNMVKVNYCAINAIPNLQTETANIQLQTEIGNYTNIKKNINYSIDIEYNGKKVATSTVQNKVEVLPNTSITSTTNISLAKKDVRLWHFERPELYNAIVTVYENRKAIHTYKERFGIRKIEVDGFQLKLNGEPIKTVGFNIIPEDRVYGNALPLERFKHMVNLMRACGANMARLSHFALPKNYIDYLDEQGIMIFEEVSLWGKDTLVNPNHPLPKLWLTKLIKQQYNHPSVIGWSVGNEIGSYKNNPLVYEYVKQAIALAKKLDSNRLVSYASNTATSQKNDPSELCDIVMVNSYGNWGKAAEIVHKNFPSKLIFFTEFGADLNDENLDNSTIPIEKMLREMRGKPYVAGASLWTFNDYRSNYWSPKTTWNTAPSENRAWGIVNSVLQPKQSYFKTKKEYQPFIVKNSLFKIENNAALFSLQLQTRDLQSFPAFIIKNYQLKIAGKNKKGEVVATHQTTIPTLLPDATITTLQTSLPYQTNIASISIEIIDQLGYNRYDTTIYTQTPIEPKIIAVHKNLNGCRVVFEQDNSAKKYYVKYGSKELTNCSDTAYLNHYIDIDDLKTDSIYQLQLIAENNAGKTEGLVVKNIELISSELPPIVWSVIPINNECFISFSTDPLDYKYEVEYGTALGKYDKRILVGNRGGIQIPFLKRNTNYFVRMRRILQWGFASEWTNEFNVTTK